MDEHDRGDHAGDEGEGPNPAASVVTSEEHPECQEALDTLYHYLDGELDDTRRSVIQRHLELCSPCLEAFDFEAELKAVVARRCRETVPEALRQRVAAALAEATAVAVSEKASVSSVPPWLPASKTVHRPES